MPATDTMERLSAKLYAYSVFHRLMGDEPTEELFEAIDVDVLRESFEILGVLPNQDVEAFLTLLSESDRDFDQLKRQYNRIFVGPAALPAPPWESVYRDNKRVVMTATTLGVRNAYKAHGFIPQRYPHVPDDHLVLELDFIAALTAEALQACQAGDVDAASKHEADAVRFTHDHLSAWAPFFAEDVRDKGKAPLYATVAQAMAAFVEATVR